MNIRIHLSASADDYAGHLLKLLAEVSLPKLLAATGAGVPDTHAENASAEEMRSA